MVGMSDDVTVVLALKRLREAKSRLAGHTPSPQAREALVAAMFTDTVRAVQVAGAARIVVVSPDPEVRRRAIGLGIDALAEAPDTGGLNDALALGAATARPGHDVLYLQADLPALTAASFAQARIAAHAHPVAFVADRHGTGTALLAVSAGHPFVPGFGPGSAARHRAAGAVELDPDRKRWPDLRCDVDTLADLRAALALRPGPATVAVTGEPAGDVAPREPQR
ncbi:2-phospho-L-lactate guanylyltransferase [Gordonia iterans]|uniref:Phosphoenolpyruvate guanylyltransferase n=2 Tax=Gordonia iterans TaxID=1004901 RepID=A0A2S0KHR4_9ACTN|nr:2-phospho-L-lactate guanylyltransferase [Gordonia iterans]